VTALGTLVLALSALIGAVPAAALSGFHAAYFSESDFLARSPGQTGQFAVGYTNTGDQAWVAGAANQQANLATAAPLNNTTDFTAGWSNGWLSANRYTAQNAALVAPGQIGFFIYNFTVPTNAAAGEHRFYGRPVIDGVTFMEDYGYYQSVVVGAGSVLITSSVPISPNSNPRPTLFGTGAGAGCTVTVFEGTNALGTGTSDSGGNFSVGLTTSLTTGPHSLTASATCPDSSFKASGNTFSYTVSSGSSGGGTFTNSAAALNTRTIQVNYNFCVAPNSVGATNTTAGANDATNPANYNLDGAGAGTGISSVTMISSTVVSIFLSSAMANPSGHSLVVSNIAPCTGAIMTTPETLGFTVNDTTAPTLVSAAATALSAGTTTRVDVTWSEPVQCAGTYSVDGITSGSGGHVDATPSGQAKCVLTTQALSQGTSHTVQVASELDSAGNTQSPNPASTTFTVSTTPSLTIVGSSALAENKIRISWSSAVNVAGTYTCRDPLANVIPCTKAAGATASDVDLTLTTPFTSPGCGGTTCSITVTVTGETGPGPQGTTLVESPASQVRSTTITKDTTKPSPVSAVQVGATQDTWDVTWTEAVSAPNACVTTTCPFRIKSGSTIIASTVTGGEGGVQLTASDGAAVGDSKTRLTAATSLTAGTYSLAITAGAVNDLAGTPNSSNAGTINLSVVDQTAPTVTGGPAIGQCGAGNPCKVFTFTYSEPMPTSGSGSATDLSHYKLNGLAVTGIASADVTRTVVTVSLSSDAPAGSNQWQITGVTDPAGNLIVPNPTLINFTRVP
jgi:hypothetical protein